MVVLLLGGCHKDPAGPSNPLFYTAPVAVSGSINFATLAAGYTHTCGVAEGGNTYCWGLNDEGQIGTDLPLDLCDDPIHGQVSCSGEPQLVSGGHRFTALALSLVHSCALTAEGAAYCWGNGNALGSPGDAGPLPVTVDGGLVFGVLSLAVGSFVSCGLIAGGQAFCWGPDAPSRGGLGTGALGDAPTPVAVGGDLRFGSLAVGQFHTCAISDSGGAYCWGGNWYGTLGQGSAGGNGGLMTLPSATAVQGGLTFRQVAAGLSHTCALTLEGAAWCWGYGYAFGGGDRYVTTPVQVDGGLAFISIGAGEASTCGLTAQGGAYCWGENSAGQLGDGTTGYRATPRAVTGGLHFTQLVVGAAHACGLTSDKHAHCWGVNQFGQVGRIPSEVNP